MSSLVKMRCRLNSSKGGYIRGLYGGLSQWVLRGILGVSTIADISTEMLEGALAGD